MKSRFFCSVMFLLILGLGSNVQARQAIGAGARHHSRHSQFIELPFNKGDMTYTLGYEYHEGGGFWQIILGYAPSISDGTEGRGIGVESILTPQLNLFFEDRNWLGGVGVLASYIRREEAENEWTDIYWQVMIGYKIPLNVVEVELMAYYPFEKWNRFRDFEADDIEFGIMIKRMF